MEAFAAHIGLAPPKEHTADDDIPDPDTVAARLKQTFRAIAAKGRASDGGE